MVFLAAAAIAQSIVLVASPLNGNTKTGTGFVIVSTSTSSQILTADHVIEGGGPPSIFVNGPHGPRYPATVVRSDSLRDVAVLAVPVGKLPALEFGDIETPTSGTDIQVTGYPTLRDVSSPLGTTSEKIPLTSLQLVTSTGKTDGETEEGESILLSATLTHGDSGAPIIDLKSGHVIGMTLAKAAGYGTQQWITGDGLGLSVAGIQAFLHPLLPTEKSPKPSFVAAIDSQGAQQVADPWTILGTSAGFVPILARQTHACVDDRGQAIANMTIEDSTFETSESINLRDCSGAIVYHADINSEAAKGMDALRVLCRDFLGFADNHRAAWESLLRFGVAVDADKNPYLALMSVERNPFRQLVIAHVFRGGPADKAGVRPGDAVAKINGRPTFALSDQFIARLLDQPAVTLLLVRSERETTARIALRRFRDLTAKGPVPR